MKRKLLLTAFLAFSVSLAFAAGGSQGSDGTQKGGVPGDGQPFGKYNPPITLRSVKAVAPYFVFEEGDSLDKNPWTETFYNQLGVQVKWDWYVSTDISTAKSWP
jgi:putative aldouronate transport system substrate-binding protein